MMKKLTALLFSMMMFSAMAWADSQTVTLSVENMTCPTCPLTIRIALERVDGVEEASVSYEDREAVITYDDSRTSVEALIEATTNVGFPATVKEG